MEGKVGKVRVIEIFCQTAALEAGTVPIHPFLNTPYHGNGSPERPHDLQLGLGENQPPPTVYMYIHAYILYLSLLTKMWLPTCLKRTNSISALRNLTVDHTNRVCIDDVICCLAQPQQDGLVKLSAYQSCDGFPCLGASTMAAVLHRLEGVVFTWQGSWPVQPRGGGCSSRGFDR